MPGTSYTWTSIVLGSAHEVIIKWRCINNTTTYLIGGAPPKQSWPMIHLPGQLGIIVGSRLHLFSACISDMAANRLLAIIEDSLYDK